MIGTIDQDKIANIPTPIDNLYMQKDIISDVFSVFIKPMNTSLSENSKLSIGAYNPTYLDGSLTYA
jgi:hypothetical protein